MSELIEDLDVDELANDAGEAPEPGHDEWFRGEVRKTLELKAAGKMTYRSIDDVIAAFGFNAR